MPPRHDPASREGFRQEGLEQIVLQPVQSLVTLEDSRLWSGGSSATWVSAYLRCPVDPKAGAGLSPSAGV
jgi:hypothetical protein